MKTPPQRSSRKISSTGLPNRQREAERGFVAGGFDGVDGVARDAELFGELGLRPADGQVNTGTRYLFPAPPRCVEGGRSL